ncbi:MAG TPA: hypothetical protein VGX03_33190 [Candidatus Binatia bacterium]|jgi:hypothetical protein|nr:hypothetical protein [Candidatus Binatia bacterium]
MLEPGIIEEIRAAWRAVGFSRNHPAMARAVPAALNLKALLEIVFLASLQQEERRAIQVRVVFFPDATTLSLKQAANHLESLPFAQPIPLSVESLRKLAPAFDQNIATLVAARNADTSGYDLVGAILYGRIASLLDNDLSSLPRPPALTLSTRMPGSVVISYGDSVVGRFDKGQFVIAKLDPLASSPFIHQILHVLAEHELYKRYENGYWFLYRACIKRIYASAAAHGHGGTVMWVPDRLRDEANKYFQTGREIADSPAGEDLIGIVLAEENSGGGGELLARYKRRLSEYLDMVAQLSCVDGALIVDEHLRPVRFATHLAAPKWTGEVFEGTHKGVPPTQKIELTRFGTRHNSAISFVGACPSTVGFVISEDGPVRAILRVGEAIWLWPDCMNTVFLDL